MVKLLGNNVNIETQDGLNSYFANEFSMHIATSINQTLQTLQTQQYQEIYHYVGNLAGFAQQVFPVLQNILDDYGLKLKTFSISRCKDEYDDSEIQKMITDKKRMQYLGSGWGAQQQVDILKNMSTNDSNGGVAGVGAGLGMGLGMGGAFGSMAQQQFSQTPFPQQSMNHQQPLSSQPNNSSLIMDKLKQLKDMLDMGLITPDEYNNKKQELLSQM